MLRQPPSGQPRKGSKHLPEAAWIPISKPFMTPLIKFGAALYFGLSSFSIQLATKGLFTKYHFNYPLCLALVQMSFASLTLYGISRPALTAKNFRMVAPLAVISCMNIICGLVGTSGLSLPMFIVLRRFTLLITIILEIIWYKKSHSVVTYGSVAIMISGAIFAAIYDLSWNIRGYVAVLLNDVLTASYLVMIKNSKDLKEIPTNHLLFYTSTISAPLLFTAAFGVGELGQLSAFGQWHDLSFKITLLGSSVMGLVLNHSQFLCTRINEPIMTSVTGLVKNSVSTVAGALLFDDFIFNMNSALGVVLSMAGSVIYTIHSVRSHTPTNGKSKEETKDPDPEDCTVRCGSGTTEEGGKTAKLSLKC